MNTHTECLNEIIKRAHVSTIQSCVRLNDIERLGYAYSHIVEDFFGVKKGTASFGIRVSEIFEQYKCADKPRMEEVKKQIKHHKFWKLKTLFLR